MKVIRKVKTCWSDPAYVRCVLIIAPGHGRDRLYYRSEGSVVRRNLRLVDPLTSMTSTSAGPERPIFNSLGIADQAASRLRLTVSIRSHN